MDDDWAELDELLLERRRELEDALVRIATIEEAAGVATEVLLDVLKGYYSPEEWERTSGRNLGVDDAD